jgi:PIN domain nuclease of toxin-antitoxin system
LDVLLDTCCLIWAASDPKKLTPRVADTLQANDTAVWVSVISCAELACLAEREYIALDRHWRTWFRDVIDMNSWGVADIDLQVVQEAYSLPGEYHRDSADRIIAATARIRHLTILTADQKILGYPHVETMW